MVAHAAALNGHKFRIYSRKQPSQLFGAQYLHHPIPEIDCGMPETVTYNLWGTPEQYRHKVYGPKWDGTVSPEDYQENHHAWDIRLAYQHLWDKYESYITNCEMTGGNTSLHVIRHVARDCDMILSTMPRKLWAQPGDVFESQKIWALGDGDYKRVHLHRPNEFEVTCSGLDGDEWYRVSNIFGFCTMEWPYFGDTPPARGASIVEKPLCHNSTAASDFIHLGRFGKWEKGVLTTDAFFEAMKVLG